MKDKKFKIETETAQEEFDRFCELWDIDDDKASMDEEDVKDFETQERRIVRAIKKGRLSIDNEGTLSYLLVKPMDPVAELKINRLKGSDYINMDKYKKNQDMHKTFSVIASMTGQTVQLISKLDGIDIKLLTSVMTLFLAS